MLLLLVVASVPARARSDAREGHASAGLEYVAADPNAPAVTEANLSASERFWPYQVALREPWAPPGGPRSLDDSLPGVLIRVEPPALARIDFGRDGLYEVPIRATDLVERANRVRTGELEKLAPNFVAAIGPRLLDAESPTPKGFDLARAAAYPAFLAVFADPEAPGFPELVDSLRPLRGRDDLLVLLFPQGRHPDTRVRDRLHALGWPLPFVYEHLAEPYTRTLLAERVPPPAILLQTAEGRVLLQTPWRGGLLPEIRSALAAPAAAPTPVAIP